MENNYKLIAETILRQLGGKEFIFMTGAKNFCILSSNRDRGIRGGIKMQVVGGFHIVISLTNEDLYNIQCYKLKRCNITNLQQENDLYAFMLKDFIEKEMGIATRIPKIVEVTTSYL